MSDQYSLVYSFPPVALLAPAADAAGRTSPYRNLSNAQKAYVVAHINQGNAATVALSLTQAKDVSGTGAKAISSVTPIFYQANTATSDGNIQQASAVSFTTDAGLYDKIVIFELLPDQVLDVANGYKTIALTTGASNAANITAAELFVIRNFQGVSAPTTYA
jgi:dihydrodipicolinate synthase/N-acetylneuraminate lyase